MLPKLKTAWASLSSRAKLLWGGLVSALFVVFSFFIGKITQKPQQQTPANEEPKTIKELGEIITEKEREMKFHDKVYQQKKKDLTEYLKTREQNIDQLKEQGSEKQLIVELEKELDR